MHSVHIQTSTGLRERS